MKVRELIRILNELDANKEIMIECDGEFKVGNITWNKFTSYYTITPTYL